MSVFRRRDRGNRWFYDFSRQRRHYQGFCVDPVTGEDARNEKHAREIEAARKLEVRSKRAIARTSGPPGSYTLGQAIIRLYRQHRKSTELHRANVKLYGNEILRKFGGEYRLIVEITKAEIDDWRDEVLAKQRTRVWIGGADRKADRTDPKNWRKGKRRLSVGSINHRLKCLAGALKIAHETRDPITGQPMLPFPPKVELLKKPKRLPRPIPDAELEKRLEVAPSWTRDAGDLARLFGLRRAEVLALETTNIDHDRRRLRFDAEEVKSDEDQFAEGGAEGYKLLKRLERQAIARGTTYLVTWPGPAFVHDHLAGRPIPLEDDGAPVWRPMKSIRRSWRTSATAAGIDKPHRFHDVRARAITEVAKVAPAAIAQGFARHADASTTALYVKVGDAEIAGAVEAAHAKRRRPGLRVVK